MAKLKDKYDPENVIKIARTFSDKKLTYAEQITYGCVFQAYLNHFDKCGMGKYAAMEAAKEEAENAIKKIRAKQK